MENKDKYIIKATNDLPQKVNYQLSIVDKILSERENKNREAIYYSSRALTYYISNKYQEAIADWTKAIELGKNQLDTYYLDRGRCKYMMGDLEGAILDCDKAMELNPTRHNRNRSCEWYDRAHLRLHRYDELKIKWGNWKLID